MRECLKLAKVGRSGSLRGVPQPGSAGRVGSRECPPRARTLHPSLGTGRETRGGPSPPSLPEFRCQVGLQPVEGGGDSDQPSGLVAPVLALQKRRGPFDVDLVPSRSILASPTLTQSPGPRVGTTAVQVAPPLAPEPVEPLGVLRGVGQLVRGGGQVLEQDATVVARGLEEDPRRGHGHRVRTEGDGCPGDTGLAFHETPHQSLVPLQVVLQVLLARLIALQHHVEEVGGVCQRVQSPLQRGMGAGQGW